MKKITEAVFTCKLAKENPNHKHHLLKIFLTNFNDSFVSLITLGTRVVFGESEETLDQMDKIKDFKKL